MKERLTHLFICCSVQVEFLSNHNCKVCTLVSLHNATLVPQKTKWIIFLKNYRTLTRFERERTREGDHRLKV